MKFERRFVELIFLFFIGMFFVSEADPVPAEGGHTRSKNSAYRLWNKEKLFQGREGVRCKACVLCAD